MSSTTKSRKDMRAIVKLVARYRSPATFEYVEEACCDVSAGGMFIKSESPASAGTLLKLECEAEGGDSGRIRGVARVVWLRREANEHGPSGMGVKFVKLEPGSKELITRTVARLAESGIEPRSMSEPPEVREAAGVASRGRSLRPAEAAHGASASVAPAAPISTSGAPPAATPTLRPGSARPAVKPLGSAPAPATGSRPPASAAIASRSSSAGPSAGPSTQVGTAHGSNGAPAESSSSGGLSGIARGSGRAQTLMGMPPVRPGEVPEVPERAALSETLAEVRTMDGAAASENPARDALERASLPVVDAPPAGGAKGAQNGGLPSVIVAEDYGVSPGNSARETTLHDSTRPAAKARANAVKVWLGVAAAVAILFAIIMADEGSTGGATSAAPSGEKAAPAPSAARPEPAPNSARSTEQNPAAAEAIAVGSAPNTTSAQSPLANSDQPGEGPAPAAESGATTKSAAESGATTKSSTESGGLKSAAESGATRAPPAANGLAAPSATPHQPATASDSSEPAKSARVDPGLAVAKPAETRPSEAVPSSPAANPSAPPAERPKAAPATAKDGMPWVIEFVTRPAGATVVVGEQSIVAPGSLRFETMPDHIKVTAKKAGFETSAAWLDRNGFTDVDGTHWRRVYMTLPNPDPAAPPPAEAPAP